ncbi:MAG: N-acetylmuramoyl-L-alanine amidase [Clostridiales bacterium]|jgi:N-acetylmuramoyl-L-alanine amidase|nr:N-acetylmuramoyl-L-alanine amidase [Clostridiales bacterium]
MFVIYKKKYIVWGVAAVLFAVGCFSAVYGIKASSIRADKPVIVIDAGHGGADGGVSGISTGVKESSLNLKFAFLLKAAVENQGYRAVLTRTTEAGLYETAFNTLEETRKSKDMRKRKEIIVASKPACVVSLHMNFFSQSSIRGAQVFYNSENPESKKLAKILQGRVNNLNREYAKRDVTALPGDYYITKAADYPACILECGFLSNPDEERLLLDPEYQEKLIYEAVNGIIIYLNTKSRSPDSADG